MANKRILVIAGSDSSGGAGLEADQKVIASHGCYAMTATTALTAQNTLGIYDIHPIPQAFIKKQLDACFDDIGVDVVKTGMLSSVETIQLVTAELKRHSVSKIVVDPVMVATTGASLFQASGMTEFYALASLALVITPNVPELKALLGLKEERIATVDDLERLARQTHAKLGSKWVLAKGGHVPFQDDMTIAKTPQESKFIVNILVGPNDQVFRITSTFQDSRSTHGTGCSLASAIASNIAMDMDVYPAVKEACKYVEVGIQSAPGYGKGYGPLNHFHRNYMLPFSRGHFVDYLLEREDMSSTWSRYVSHDFVRALGSGTLPLESFKGYLMQDYLFLTQFARAIALGAYKSKTLKNITAAAAVAQNMENEVAFHIRFCLGFGVTRQDMDAVEELTACTAYTRYVLDIGQSEDWLALQIALAPCTIGYGVAARLLHEDQLTKRDENLYWPWIQAYTSDKYKGIVKIMRDRLEEHVFLQSPSRIEELVQIFKRTTQLEIAFWEMHPCK